MTTNDTYVSMQSSDNEMVRDLLRLAKPCDLHNMSNGDYLYVH